MTTRRKIGLKERVILARRAGAEHDRLDDHPIVAHDERLMRMAKPSLRAGGAGQLKIALERRAARKSQCAPLYSPVRSLGGVSSEAFVRLRGLLSASIFCVLFLMSPVKSMEMGELPFAILCESPNGVIVVGYLSRINPDGTALYGTVVGQRVAQVDASGLILPSELAAGGGSCEGRTIDDLRDTGQTRSFSE